MGGCKFSRTQWKLHEMKYTVPTSSRLIGRWSVGCLRSRAERVLEEKTPSLHIGILDVKGKAPPCVVEKEKKKEGGEK